MQTSNSKTFPSMPLTRWVIGFGMASLLATAAGIIYYTHSPKSTSTATQTIVAAQATKITALGRLEPKGQVIKLSAPAAQGIVPRIDRLLVQVGDAVAVDQVVAILDSHDRLQSAVNEAKEQVKVAEANLNRVTAGAQAGEIAAQQATIARLKAQLAGEVQTQAATLARLRAESQNAQSEYQRHASLYQAGAISASALDTKSLAVQVAAEKVNEAGANSDRSVETLNQQIREAEATLARITEVRPGNVAAAQAEIDRAVAGVARAETELGTAYVRAPQAGRVLRVHSHPGETVSAVGIMELGQTDQMYAVAEIYEGDIGKIQIGQTAIVTADSVTGKLSGQVEQIGWAIAKQDILNTDPTAVTDARVVEVKIKLDRAASAKVAQLTNLQVNVEIER